MNCPGHVQIFNVGQKSYRDLPLRLAEFGSCHRYEPSGALQGLMRVRAFTQDDAHIFCRQDQIESETTDFVQLLRQVYQDLGVELCHVKLALRPDKRAGSDDLWDEAESKLKRAAETAGVFVELLPGEGAFYGPKLEFHLKDAIGRTWQCGTLQLDFVLPERLQASYIQEDATKARPVILHRAILGSFERFLGILIEHYGGALPLWLAPVQIVIANITSDTEPYAQSVATGLERASWRVACDFRNEKITYKIREHSLAKVPLIAVIGRKEAEEGLINLRRLGSSDSTTITLANLTKILQEEARAPDQA